MERRAHDDENGMKMSKKWDLSEQMSNNGAEGYSHWRKSNACRTAELAQSYTCLVMLPSSPTIRPAFHPRSRNSQR